MNKVPQALQESWDAKQRFYEQYQGKSIREIIEKIEHKKFKRKKLVSA